MSLLSVNKLTVSYGAHTALDNLSLDIKAGELVGVIGPNGAGKTSFIKALCGRVPVDGQVSINGHSIKRGHDRRALIGLVPQDIGLYEHLTAQENLDVMARLLSVPRRERHKFVDKALESVGMTEKSKSYVKDLSGGMKRRINVAAAIMHDPKLVIFDEPTAGIDIPARDTVHRLARELAETGKSVILVTHELEQAEALCDKILLLKNGQRLAYESPASLLSRYYGDKREVLVRFASPPSNETLGQMRPFEFKQGELPTIWKSMTQASEVSFVSAFMTALKNGDKLVREITVRRPNLTNLMHEIETCEERQS
jgi:ABC-2 type transport system ATP-binding protein